MVSTNALSQPFAALQTASTQALADVNLPTRKTEDWKYSSRKLGKVDQLALAPISKAALASAFNLGGIKLNIVNGQADFDTSTVPEHLSVKHFKELSAEEVAQVGAGAIAANTNLHFAQLNQSSFNDGLFISIAATAELQQPIELNIHQDAPGISHPRVFVLLGKHAQATVIETFSFGELSDTALQNAVVDIQQEAGSRLRYIRMDMDQQMQSKSLAATGVQLKRDAYFESHCLGLGSAMSRHDLRVHMLEPGAECSLNGVTVTKDKQHYDNHTCIEHIAPHCQSNENYRCIADNESQIVFNGRIHIHRDAQKTLGAMSNKNLLLSSGAEINSKPELEIYADDVKCAHGTTIGQLEEEEVYYLQTRGITEQQARQMLTLGFVLELVRATPIETIAEAWEQKLSALLSFEDN